jgi:hypothetical protein
MPEAPQLRRRKWLTLIGGAAVMITSMVSACSAPAPSADPAAATQLNDFLRENFGAPGLETSWWPNITGVSVEGSTAVILTNLNSSGTAASNICSAASGFVYAQGNERVGLSSVDVRGANGQSLVVRRSSQDLC